MKILVPVIASIASLAAVVHPAAASCRSPTTVWENIGRCLSPNQNRGSVQGNGTLGTNTRSMSHTVGIAGGNVSGRARGLDFFGNIAGGGACQLTVSPGNTGFTASGQCNGARNHFMTITF